MGSRQRDAGRNAQLRRVFNMLRELNRSSGVSIAQLAERYGTGERTIRRNLDAFQEEGFPLISEAIGEHNRKLWRLATNDHAQRLSRLVDSGH